jgi:hypothetical protein
MAHDPEVSGRFGIVDLIFANHPLDEKRALDWLVKLYPRQATWSEAMDQIKDFLGSKNATSSHIADQIDRAEPLLRPWLYGP